MQFQVTIFRLISSSIQLKYAAKLKVMLLYIRNPSLAVMRWRRGVRSAVDLERYYCQRINTLEVFVIDVWLAPQQVCI
jgi:hypothetical protein